VHAATWITIAASVKLFQALGNLERYSGLRFGLKIPFVLNLKGASREKPVSIES
jgi:hypothetical protein